MTPAGSGKFLVEAMMEAKDAVTPAHWVGAQTSSVPQVRYNTALGTAPWVGEGLRTIESIDETEEAQSAACASRDSWCATQQRRSNSKDSTSTHGLPTAVRTSGIAAPPSRISMTSLRARLDQAFSRAGAGSESEQAHIPHAVDVSASSLFGTTAAKSTSGGLGHSGTLEQRGCSPTVGMVEDSGDALDMSGAADMVVTATGPSSQTNSSNSKPTAKKGTFKQLGKKLAKWLSLNDKTSSSSRSTPQRSTKSLDLHDVERTAAATAAHSPPVPTTTSSLLQEAAWTGSAGAGDGGELSEAAVAAALERAWSTGMQSSSLPQLHQQGLYATYDIQNTPPSMSRGLSRLSRQLRNDLVVEGDERDSCDGDPSADKTGYMTNMAQPGRSSAHQQRMGGSLYEYGNWPMSSSRRASQDVAPRNVVVTAPLQPGPGSSGGGVMGCVRRSLDMSSCPPNMRRSMDTSTMQVASSSGISSNARRSMDMSAPPANIRHSMDASWQARSTAQSAYGGPVAGRYGGLAGSLATNGGASTSGSRRSSFNLANALSTGGVAIHHTAVTPTYSMASPAPSLMRSSTRGISRASTRDLSAADTCPPGIAVMYAPSGSTHGGIATSALNNESSGGLGALSVGGLQYELLTGFTRPGSNVRMSGDWARQHSASLAPASATSACLTVGSGTMGSSLFSLPTTVGALGHGLSHTTTGLSRGNSAALTHEESSSRLMGRMVSRGDMLHMVPVQQAAPPLKISEFDASMI